MTRMRNRLAAEDGFTLIEMLVAAIVLAVGIGGAITIFIGSNHASSAAERNSVGIDQAQQTIENARALPYSQIGLNGSSWTSAGLGATDPTARVSGSNFTPVSGASSEPMIVPGPNGATSPALTPYRQVTLGSGGSAVVAKIYTFVTYRPESCPLLSASSLGPLGTAATSSLSGLSSVLNNWSLNSSLSTLSGSITGATNNLSGLLNLLLGGVLTNANQIVAKGADLKPTVTNLQNTITSTRGTISLTASALGNLQNLDLCNLDLSLIQNVKNQLTTLTNTSGTGLLDTSSLSSMVSTLTNLGDVTNLFNGVSSVNCGPLNLLCVLGGTVANLLQSTNSQLASLVPGITTNESVLKSQLAALTGTTGLLTKTSAALSSISSSVSALATSSTGPTPQSSKRVTVAVVLDPAGKVGPLQPIWMSTVITDPKAGLL